MEIGIITGASSGLGNVFSKKIIEKLDLDQVWLIARREDRLNEIKERYPDKDIVCLSLDLSDRESFCALADKLEREQPHIKVLVNNAGVCKMDSFMNHKDTDIYSIIDINVIAMTMMNKVCLPYMSKGSYEIITGSVSSFAPIPYQSVYSASKAYVRFFSRALHEELKEKGINVLLLSPGNMETGMLKKDETNGKISFLPFLNLDQITEKSLLKAQQNKASYIPNIVYKSYYVLMKILPVSLTLKITNLK